MGIHIPSSSVGCSLKDIAEARAKLDLLEQHYRRTHVSFVTLTDPDVPAICAQYNVSYEPIARTSWHETEIDGKTVLQPVQHISYQVSEDDYTRLRKMEVI